MNSSDYKVIRKERYEGVMPKDWIIDKERGYFLFPALRKLGRREHKKKDEVRIILCIKEYAVRPLSSSRKKQQKLYRQSSRFKKMQKIYNKTYKKKMANMLLGEG